MQWDTPMRKYGILLILGLVFAFIAAHARVGIFRRANPGEPANKYVREQMEAQQLLPQEIKVIREKYPDAVVTSSGLRYLVRAPGTGERPAHGARLVVHYQGSLLANGEVFDSSYARNQAFTFRVGTGAVIKGWDEALATMTKGEKRTLIIPWWLGYGLNNHGSIPSRSTLVFEVELLDIR